MARPDRYLRTGELVPEIYPGTVLSLNRAMRDAKTASARYDGDHTIFALRGRTRSLVQVYTDGTQDWEPELGTN